MLGHHPIAGGKCLPPNQPKQSVAHREERNDCLSKLVANGQIELVDLADHDVEAVADLVRQNRRASLLQVLARCIAIDLYRESREKSK